jgi:signal transduction histidine kinase
MSTRQEIIESYERKLHSLEHDIRNEVARDLHDGAIGALSLAVFESDMLIIELRKAKLDHFGERAKSLQEAIMGAVETIRQIMAQTSPIPAAPDGLMTLLDTLVHEIRRHQGVSCNLIYDEPLLIKDRQAATHIYRIVQEGITNAIKHGRADEILVTFDIRPDNSIDLYVADNGIGLQKTASRKGTGVGLRSMQGRAKKLGGTIKLEPGPRHGLILHLKTGPLDLFEETSS